MKYDLTVVLPSIRKDRLSEFYSSLYLSMGKYHQSFELIVVSPYNLPEIIDGIPNIKLVKDFGSPARCVQIGAALAEGEFITWSSDDGLYYGNALEQCIDLLKTKHDEDAIIVRYSEGVGRTGQEPPSNYWDAWTHPDLRMPFVEKHWKIAPVGMYRTKRFYDLGGLDCRFEHANMNSHDLAFRSQADSGLFFESPTVVMGCDQMPGWSGDHGPIEDAYWKNDKELFANTWSNTRQKRIDFNNWKDAPAVWRRFK